MVYTIDQSYEEGIHEGLREGLIHGFRGYGRDDYAPASGISEFNSRSFHQTAYRLLQLCGAQSRAMRVLVAGPGAGREVHDILAYAPHAHVDVISRSPYNPYLHCLEQMTRARVEECKRMTARHCGSVTPTNMHDAAHPDDMLQLQRDRIAEYFQVLPPEETQRTRQYVGETDEVLLQNSFGAEFAYDQMGAVYYGSSRSYAVDRCAHMRRWLERMLSPSGCFFAAVNPLDAHRRRLFLEDYAVILQRTRNREALYLGPECPIRVVFNIPLGATRTVTLPGKHALRRALGLFVGRGECMSEACVEGQ